MQIIGMHSTMTTPIGCQDPKNIETLIMRHWVFVVRPITAAVIFLHGLSIALAVTGNKAH